MEQFDAITVKLQQVYDEWSAEASGQHAVRQKIVSDFQEFVQKIEGCEGTYITQWWGDSVDVVIQVLLWNCLDQHTLG